MLNRILVKVAGSLLLLSFPSNALPAQISPTVDQSQTGVLYPQAGVKLKGNLVITSTAVYNGDEIQTGELSTLLTGNGISIQLKPHTSLLFGRVVELGCGGLVVVTSKSISVRFAGMEVVPAGNPAKLEIDNAGGIITVTVRNGVASINQGGQIWPLREGQSVTRPSTQRCPAAAGGAHTTPPAASSTLLGGSKVYWIVGGVAAGGIAAGVLATRGEKRISPSAP